MTAVFQRLSKEKVVVGHHYFTPDFSTPVFDFRITPDVKRYFSGSKDAGISATTYASKGSPGEQYGAVDWLRLKAGDKSVESKLAYRVHTAGGKAPANCKGRGGSFMVDYAAEYCLFCPFLANRRVSVFGLFWFIFGFWFSFSTGLMQDCG